MVNYTPYEGYGVDAFPELRGVASKRTVYRVTSLANSGPGTLRDAVSRGNRLVRFAVVGTITLQTDITFRAGNIVVDGFTAPGAGITIRARGFRIFGDQGAHQILIRGLRLRDAYGSDSTPSASGIGFSIARGATGVVILHNSVTGFYHGAFNVGSDSTRDVTAAWNLFGQGRDPHNLPILIATGAARVSFHHNLVFNGSERMPEIRSPHGRFTADVRNNVFIAWGHRACGIQQGGRANVVNNYFFNPSGAVANHQRAIYVWNDGHAYVAGNVSGNGAAITTHLNRQGTTKTLFAAPAVRTQPACEAAWAVLRQAGRLPRDATDAALVATLRLPACPEPKPEPPPKVAPLPEPDPPAQPEPTPTPEPPAPDPDQVPPWPAPPPSPTALEWAIADTTEALTRVEGQPRSRPLDFAAEYLRQALRWLQESRTP